jgi:hypothetical protein
MEVLNSTSTLAAAAASSVAAPSPPTSRPRIVPNAFVLLSNWRYVEYSILRMIAGWGRCAGDWEDKLAVCYHTWLQAQIVDRYRKRLDMYPGGKPDAPVNVAFERVVNAVLLAPTWNDAMAGIHSVLNPLLIKTYTDYIATSHPVHDRPTFELLRETMDLKRQEQQWYEDFRRRHPHFISKSYLKRIEQALSPLGGNLAGVVEAGQTPARACGVGTDFRLPITPGRVKNWDKSPNVIPLCEIDWSTSIEARRLFFMIGYCWEMGVAEQQLRWIYSAEFMPFEFIYNESRHMWDESRHGNSGYHRLRDFGLDFEHFGYSSYGVKGDGYLPPMTPKDVYEAFYGVTQIAETGYFATKRYCFDDFATHGDDASAEMMQYDIIDETSHVEYGRIWLEEMASRAGVDEDYRKRGAAERASAQAKSDERVAMMRRIMAGYDPPPVADAPAHGGECVNPGSVPAADELRNPATLKHYQWLLAELRGQHPLKNASEAPVRPNLPM